MDCHLSHRGSEADMNRLPLLPPQSTLLPDQPRDSVRVANHLESRPGRVALLLVLLVVACEGSAPTRALLKSRDAEWSSRLASLRDRQVNVAARFGHLAAGAFTGDEVRRTAGRRAVEASVEGHRLTIADLETRRQQSVGEVEAALRHGRQEGEQALEQVTAQMGGYLATEEQQLFATETDLARFDEGASSKPEGSKQ
jgi:hypothetical protein